MKLKLTFLALIAFSLYTLNSQAQSYAKGDNVANLTIGMGNGSVGGSFGVAFGVSGEHCFFDELINGDFSVGIGGYLGFSATKDQFSNGFYNYGYKYTTFAIAGRGTFHWTGVEGLDTYAGLHLGGAIVSSKFDGNQNSGIDYPSAESGGVLVAPFVGARYYFNDAFCVVGELGGGLGFLNAGVGFKF